MNERIKELIEQADNFEILPDEEFCDTDFLADIDPRRLKKFAELIVKDCMAISKTWEDQLEKAKLPSEADAVGIVAYRISRQFGVKE